ncbi:helix-turn-helix transcriptional regulator [bacterium]|nr:helix-turn-helix transcriptional regulator [bacterium]
MKFAELQNYLINKLRRQVTQTEIAQALKLEKSSISMRIKRNSELNVAHKQRIEEFFRIKFEDSDDCIYSENLPLPIRGNIEASLGTGRDVFSEEVTDYFCLPKSLMKKIGASLTDSCIINTTGSSMYPTIIGGQDQILVDLSKKEIFDGKIYIFRMDNTLFAKRLQKLPKDKIRVISDNADYEPYTIDLNEDSSNFEIIGRVMWISRPC